jgi:hypothetical protein
MAAEEDNLEEQLQCCYIGVIGRRGVFCMNPLLRRNTNAANRRVSRLVALRNESLAVAKALEDRFKWR